MCVHKVINDSELVNFHEFFKFSKAVHTRNTRFAINDKLTISLYKTNRTQRSFKYFGAKIWNEIPLKIKQLPAHKFKKECKQSFLYTE